MTHSLTSCDVLVVGGGGAGVISSIIASRKGLDVVLATRCPPVSGNTRLIGGVMALPDEDDVDTFLSDLEKSSCGIGEPKLRRRLTREIARLDNMFREIFGLGLSSLFRIKLGGHSTARSVAIPGSGQALNLFLKNALLKSDVEVIPYCHLISLLEREGRVLGAVFYLSNKGSFLSVLSKAVILSTGGYCWAYYPHTDVSRESTGAGVSCAFEVGAKLVDMEQVQFIPFAITYPESLVGLMCGEPYTAGPKGVLVNSKGEEVMRDIPSKTRAEVSEAIVLEVLKGGGGPHGGLFLDLRKNKNDEEGKVIFEHYTKGLFRELGELVRFAYGEKAFMWDEPWEIYPTAHYSMGGVFVDESCWTGVPGLWAVGETAGGFHGGNRLGSVSLAEVFAMGCACADAASEWATSCKAGRLKKNEVESSLKKLLPSGGEENPLNMVSQVQKVMWSYGGPVRKEEGLLEGIRALEELERRLNHVGVSGGSVFNEKLIGFLDLKSLFLVSKATLLSALHRRESRGAHLRVDFPKLSPELSSSIFVGRGEEGNMEVYFGR